MNSLLRIGRVGTFCAVAFANLALAADLPKEGMYDVTVCLKRTITRIDYSDTRYAWTSVETGTSHSNPPGGSNTCIGVAKNGDKRLTRFYIGDDGKVHREAVSGTGRYDGMVAKGTLEILGPQPELKTGQQEFCNHQTGTYTLK